MFSIVSSLGLAAIAAVGANAATLGAYNVDPNSVSVSGISSGGYMSAQLGIAYSSVFKTGFGAFAGGPYDCARSQSYLNCMYNNIPLIAIPTNNMRTGSGIQFDPVENLKSRKIYMQVGSEDRVIGPNVMKQLDAELANFYDSSKTTFVTTSGAAHTFPTDFDGTGNNACGESAAPYVSNCGYDGAGAVLEWMYGDLTPRNTGELTGSVLSFDQTGSYGSPGMGSSGYMYVPNACEDGSTVCKLHVVLHGCLQSYTNVQSTFIDNSGYSKWADTNNIIILFPQAVPDNVPHVIWNGIAVPNANGCWDWVGWYGIDSDVRTGVQMTAMVNQVKQIISGYKA
ncbi:hypothetical protein FQN50_008437 [Emmonsiellopsis sp. PD_5]|nr:hypothetical protein FQN50_008437 [Emmonsiellopsis sp. PD_5]